MSYRWLLVLAVTVASAACAGDDPSISSDDCLAVRARVVDLQLDAAGGSELDEAELAEHRRLRLAANRDEYVASCLSTHTRDSIDCALGATSLDQYRACL